MKKKILKAAFIVFISVIAVLLIWNLTDCATVHIDGQTAEISFADSRQLRLLLSVEKTDFIEYACGFSPDYSVQIGGLTYCLAQDDCSTVYIKELNFYYAIPEEEHITLHEMLNSVI